IDWGNGDFETALGGASHMGRRDIAEFLLEHNARMDIFAATMLGRLEIVQPAVAAFPNIVHVPGPHRIPLIVHAEKGGPPAKAVWEFLRPLAGQPKPPR
ncbi:MAG TPA: ankyrin repeat domain-containing protein, partial [Gammaproteobacteria bacterium]|nr:ankyrin repeat domain-containing protein [Gammaproteobacteria bacterium]